MTGSLVSGLDQLLADRCETASVPGASVAVWAAGDLQTAVYGRANEDSGEPVTAATPFRIGSISKLFTAALVVRLADVGKLRLDQAIADLIPELRLGADHMDRITVSQLLTHSSGLFGDYFADFGVGDDCRERYVSTLRDVSTVHRPGETFGYCNTGFVLAGYLVERVVGLPWEQVVERDLLRPLGMADTANVLEEDRAAWRNTGRSDNPWVARLAEGHRIGRDGHVVAVEGPVAPTWTRVAAPAGSTLAGTPRDLIRFGCALTGLTDTEVVSPSGVAAMLSGQLPLPNGRGRIGLGWHLEDWDGVRVAHHGGGHAGQGSWLLVVPHKRVAVAVSANAQWANRTVQALVSDVVHSLTGTKWPSGPTFDRAAPPAGVPADLYAGSYFPFARVTAQGVLRWHGRESQLAPINGAHFRSGSGPVTFSSPDRQGRARFLHIDESVLVRIPDQPMPTGQPLPSAPWS